MTRRRLSKRDKIKRSLKKTIKNTIHKRNVKIAKSRKRLKGAMSYVKFLTTETFNENEKHLLSKGLKFIPRPPFKGAKKALLNDFNETARKMRLTFQFDDGKDTYDPHPFLQKSNYQPETSCKAIEDYVFATKMELNNLHINRK